ncbi:serine/threonine-protein kinase [Streptomyces sp. Ru87]|nr:serine/threonine-protein kinase [Streptomyces sp. Ru87]
MSGAGEIIGGRFELLERLGSGGMGTVWRARDSALEREVALKEVRPLDPAPAEADSGLSRMLRERVLREARALARLSHPHVVTIHHIVDADPYPWLVMELLPAKTLEDRLAGGPLPVAEAARIGRELLSALTAAHSAGVHHRDVKPSNVLLRPDGSAVLTDFGIAAVQDSPTLTPTGEVIGSPEYVAPERIRGAEDLPAADLWSLGMLLYVAVEGVSPMRRLTNLATLAAVLDEPVPPARNAGPLAPVLEELLVHDPYARPDAGRLDTLLLLAEAAEGHPPHHPPRLDAPPPVRAAAPPETAGPAGPGGSGGPAGARRPAGARGPAGARESAGPPGPAAPAARAAPPPRPGRRTAWVAAAAAVAGALVASGVYLAAQPGGDSVGGGPGAASPTGDDPEPGSPTTPDAPGTPAPTPEAGTWIAQLAAVPSAAGRAARDERLADVRRQVPEAVLLHTDAFASLRPGHWVVHAARPFGSGTEAVAFCAERGRTTPRDCAGRYLSHSAGDRALICHPAPEGGATGRCTTS